jgi:CHAT domain-containing protein/Tfp pilus assembly protein PilF
MKAARAVARALQRAPLPRQAARAWAAYFQAILASDSHQWDVAEQHALTALRLAAEPELRGRACNELGILYDHLGRWDDATAFYRIGLAAFEQINDQLYVAKLAKNLGTVLVRGVEAGALPAESLAEAAALERRALELFRTHEQPALEAATWNELGTVFKAQGRWTEAQECYERFRARCVAAGDRLGEGQALNNLGELLRGHGRPVEAEAAFCQAQALVVGHAWEEADVQINLAQAHLDQGNRAAATAAADQALVGIESLRARLQTAAARVDFFATQERAYAFRARLARLAGQADTVFALAERAKARTFVELLAGQRVRPRAAIPRRWLQQEAALRRQLEALYDAAATDPTLHRTAIAEAEARWQELRHRIAGRDAEYGSLGQAAPLTPEAVQARLPADVALLEYYADDHELLACLVRRDTIRVFPLGITLADPSTVLRLRSGCSSGQALAAASFDRRGRPRGLVAEGGKLGRPWILARLGQALLGPVLPHLAALELLCIVPHGPLHHLPFGALSCGEDGPRLSQQVGAVVQAPSATVLLEYCQSQQTTICAGAGLRSRACVLGYNGEALHHAEAEAQTVAACLGTSAWTGPAATHAALDAQAPAARYVHLACPGLFRPDQPLRSGLRLADGFLDVAETFRRIRLAAELVVLSGCETGLGHLHSGDEIVGLVRAWLYAGAPSVLVSLWTVDDLSTRLLMQEFYERLEVTGPPWALVQAQAAIAALTPEVLHERLLAAGLDRVQAQQELARLATLWPEPLSRPLDHPYFWAPFVLQGGQVPNV